MWSLCTINFLKKNYLRYLFSENYICSQIKGKNIKIHKSKLTELWYKKYIFLVKAKHF